MLLTKVSFNIFIILFLKLFFKIFVLETIIGVIATVFLKFQTEIFYLIQIVSKYHLTLSVLSYCRNQVQDNYCP